jgi:AcrR family transcriptional regulator
MKEKTANDKKNYKRQRVKIYFLEAAKEIISSEGVENISVRKVADIAGYSYATIYNYFSDLNELLCEVKVSMINDIAEWLQKKMQQSTYDIEGIKKLFGVYISYYFKNPNIFRFFYLHSLEKPDKRMADGVEEPDYSEMWKETFRGLVIEGKLQEKDIEVLSKIFIYSIHGMLVLSLSYNGDLTEENVYKDIEKIVDYLLK